MLFTVMMTAYGVRAILSVAIYAMMSKNPPGEDTPVSNYLFL